MSRGCAAIPSDALESDNLKSVNFPGAGQGENDTHHSLELGSLGRVSGYRHSFLDQLSVDCHFICSSQQNRVATDGHGLISPQLKT